MPNGENSPQEVWDARKIHWKNLARAQRPFVARPGIGPKRQYQWETRAFHEFLLARAKMPFAWGTNDCALFAADGVLAITGVDIAADFRGKYSTEAEAFAVVHEICGGADVGAAAAYCAEKHGLVEWKSPLKARRGDLVVLEHGAGPGGVVSGLIGLSGHPVLPGDKGLFRLPITAVKRAWHYE